MNASETALELRAPPRQTAPSAPKTSVPQQIVSRPVSRSGAAAPSAGDRGQDRGPVVSGPLALERRALLRVLGVRADHCGRSFFVWRSPAVRVLCDEATPRSGSDQQFAIAFVADAGACGAFQCEITSREAGGKVSVWHAGARLVGEIILLSAHQVEAFNEFLRRLESARARGACYVETAYIAGAVARAIASTTPPRSVAGSELAGTRAPTAGRTHG